MAGKNAKTAIGVGLVVLLALIVGTVIALRHKIAHQFALADGRRSLANHSAAICDMTSFYTTPASYFDRITAFPAWKSVPRGFQVFNHVPLEIGGMICLWGERNTKAGIVFPEQLLGISVNQKFETLYVYHTAFFASPQGTPVYELVFRYADGSSVTNEILYGTHVTDWYATRGKPVVGPTGANSKLAWSGDAFAKAKGKPQQLRFCLTALKNPQPAIEVTAIDLYSSKNATAGCIHAMTTGRSGLMD